MQELTAQRLDKWLWAARFYKTRHLAQEAVAGGKVHLNGQRTKPSKEVKVGDEVVIHIEHYAWELCVVGLNPQRRPAEEARQLYAESPTSFAKRQALISEHKAQNALLGYPQRSQKPNKKDRRLIHRFVQKQSE